MESQQAPDGTVYEYNPNDPVEVARVAALCEPSIETQRARARAAFEAAAPEAAKQAEQNIALGAGGFSAADLQGMIASAVAAAMAAGGIPAQAHSQATSPAVDAAIAEDQGGTSNA